MLSSRSNDDCHERRQRWFQFPQLVLVSDLHLCHIFPFFTNWDKVQGEEVGAKRRRGQSHHVRSGKRNHGKKGEWISDLEKETMWKVKLYLTAALIERRLSGCPRSCIRQRRSPWLEMGGHEMDLKKVQNTLKLHHFLCFFYKK